MSRLSGGKPKVLAAVRPNAGLEALYRRKIVSLLEEMHNSLVYWLGAAYRANEPEIAQDESPAAALRNAMRRLSRRWLARFDVAAKELAAYFAKAANQRSDTALRQILKKAGISVEFRMTRAQNDILQATIGEQVGLIKSIAQQHLTQVEGLVMRSVQTGRDLETLTRGLHDRFGVTKRRAAFIARDQNNKATASMTRARQLEMGITEAIWMHSTAGKHPRPEHLAFNGKRYDVAKGAFLEGKWTWPGVEINCRCVSKSVIPGFA